VNRSERTPIERRGQEVRLPWSRVVICSLVVAAGTLAASGADETAADPFVVPRTTSEVVIDGFVDEVAWEGALRLTLEYEVRPGENIPPPVRTEVFITYDTKRVLVAFRAHDPEPEKIRARFHDRDKMWPDDWVGIVFDTFNDERRAYEFMSNPFGVQTDAINDDVQKRYDTSWDAIWQSAGRLTGSGYEVEMGIPFNQIRFQGTDGPQIWGVDAFRSLPRSDRHHIGLFPRDRGANSYLAQTSKLSGFEGASPGRNLEVVPTLTVIGNERLPDFPDSEARESSTKAELGATVRWGLSPNVTLSAAVNPDFSQVEADAVQLRINEQFALFFPEARPFFLESADYFSTHLNLLYTRMVADPAAALKLTGKLDGHTFGVFSAVDQVTNVIVPGSQGSEQGSFDASNVATVGRYRYDSGLNSTIGAMVTDREGEDGYFNRVAAADTLIRFGESDSLSAQLAWSETRYSTEMVEEFDLGDLQASGHAFTAEYVHSVRDWFTFARYSDRGEGFRADLGFIPRVDFRQLRVGGGRLWWGDSGDFYNRMELGAAGHRSDEQNGDPLDREVELWVQYGGPLQSSVHLEISGRDQVFDGVAFDNLFLQRFRFDIRPSAQIRLELAGRFGDWIDFDNVRPATRREIEPELELNLGRHFSAFFEYTYSDLDVEGGRLFTAKVPQTKMVWQFNNRTFVRAIVQYTDIERNPELYDDPEEIDRIERDFFIQLLYSYTINPQTVFFLGYSETGFENQDYSMTSIDRTLFMKIGYAFVW
jgi:hypothetical protein